MSGFTYPAALYDIVKKRWLHISSSQKFVPPLLDEASFREILDVAFHASFLTEEGRRQWFRVTYMSYKDLEEGRIVNADSIKSIKFKRPRNFNVSELVKLAPAADPTQVLIGVDRGDNGLSIWGLIEAGMSWWKYGRHEISGAPSPPNTFTISSKTPGQVTVSCMGEIVVTLNQGRIVNLLLRYSKRDQ